MGSTSTSKVMRRASVVALWAAAIAGCEGQGRPPLIADPGTHEAVVGKELVVVVQATDPDGDELEYAFSSPMRPRIEASATLVASPDGRAVFTWTPLADDLGRHVLELRVDDGTYEASAPLTIVVRGTGDDSQPTFTEPLDEGRVYDLADGPCLPPLTIRVTDPDDTAIELRMEEPVLAGSTLETSPDGLQGLWSWCPSAGQQAAASVHELVLAADDGENPATLKRFSIFLVRDGASCPCACEDDEGEDDDDRERALANDPMPEGTLTRRLCPRDEDWIALVVPQRARVRALLSGPPTPDMALQLATAEGQPLSVAATPGTSEEAIDSACLEPGTYVLRVFSLDLEHAGDYQLGHVLDASGC